MSHAVHGWRSVNCLLSRDHFGVGCRPVVNSVTSPRPRVGSPVVEYQRFTLDEAKRGCATGWCFNAGWFRRASGLEWAWFSREVGDGTTNEP